MYAEGRIESTRLCDYLTSLPILLHCVVVIHTLMNNTTTKIINITLGTLLTLILIANQISIVSAKKNISIVQSSARKASPTNLSNSEFTGNALDDAIKLTISQGTPAVYGEELGVSFDRVQETIDALRSFDPGYGNQKIMLNEPEKKRYIKIGLSISCEYCCGAKAIVFPNGEAACGCAHSQAMRGLAAYLLKNHGTEYSDDEILRELARWKGMFFPKQMIEKMIVALQNSSFAPDTAALALGIELPSYGTQPKNAPLPSEFQNLPGMVGGC